MPRKLHCILVVALTTSAFLNAQIKSFRPPAVPLVCSDPYLSIWMEADRATDDVTRHWTHAPHPLVSLIRVDGQTLRILGNSPQNLPAMRQTSLEVTPTSTTYRFENSKVAVTMTFLSPALPNDLEVYSRPVTYLSWHVRSLDKRLHKVQIYESSSGLLTVNNPRQSVEWSRLKMGSLTALRISSSDQTYLRPAGDDVRINWGSLYAVSATKGSNAAQGNGRMLERAFANSGEIGQNQGLSVAGPADVDEPVLAFSFDMGIVSGKAKSRRMMIGYDEVYAINYFGTRLPPYWRRNGESPSQLFRKADREYRALQSRAHAFDVELTRDATTVGGLKYAQILALAYRQCVAANGLASDANGQPLLFTKENTSNGDIATVDVIFPMDPIWVLLSPSLAKASLVSNFMYAASSHWKFPNAPHDLGTYPQVTGRDDGGEGMPVEESGNMILLTDAIAHAEGHAKFASRYWPQLTQWARYLDQYGLDPEDQLCTDDFMGHLAHNANLSVKAILALAAYGDLCRMRGDLAEADRYTHLARADARHWIKVAEIQDHSLLAFDTPNSWSQKYNLVWDQILGLNIFPSLVRHKEIAFYRKQLLKYGLPLDSRTKLTKSDWSIWSATMADNLQDFAAFVDPIYDYLNSTTTRDPIADSYETDKVSSGGMHARPVVGGFFIKMLSDRNIWAKWAHRDLEHVGAWAALPEPPQVIEIVPTGRAANPTWHFTTEKPATGWESPHFDDSGWRQGAAAFGTKGTPGINVMTPWSSDDIWLRRTVKLQKKNYIHALLEVFHDEDVEVYLNGVLAARESGFITDYESLDISSAAKKLLRPGALITFAVHCHQTTGGQGIDVGLVIPKEPSPVHPKH